MNVTWLDLLHELCLQNGWALLLTAEHQAFGFAAARTVLRNLDVIEPAHGSLLCRRRRLTEGELVVRCDVAAVDGDLQAAAELLVGVIAQDREQAA